MSKLSGRKVVCGAVAVMALSLSAANLVRADSFSDQAAKLDIVGVHIGMTPAEAKSVLTQHGMDWVETKSDLGISEGQFVSLAVAHSGTGQTADMVSIFFSTPPGNSKVVAVARNVSFDASAAPTFKNLLSGLIEKYGQPTWTEGTWSGWGWDKAGQSSKLDICSKDDSAFVGRGLLGGQPQSALRWWDGIPGLQKMDDRNCAIMVKASAIAGQDGVVTKLNVELVDLHDALQAAIATNAHVAQVQQAKKDEALKKAGGNKPAL